MRWGLLAAGVGIYLAALIFTAPATLADAGARTSTDGQVRLANAQGTLWSGRAQLNIRDAAGRNGLAKTLSWVLRPGELFRGRLAYDIEVDPGFPSFPLIVTWSRIEIANVTISVPAAALGLVASGIAPLELAGDMQLRVSTLSIARAQMQGSATIIWRAAGSPYAPLSPLGDYEVRLVGDGSALRATLLTLKGPLQLAGQGSWAIGARPVFKATANASPESRQQLAPFLRTFAVERDDGSFELKTN